MWFDMGDTPISASEAGGAEKMSDWKAVLYGAAIGMMIVINYYLSAIHNDLHLLLEKIK